MPDGQCRPLEGVARSAAGVLLNSGASRSNSTATAKRAIEVGLEVNAGHDLNLHSLPPFLKAVPQVAEVSIGHALIADALEFGLPETVRKYLAACEH